MPASRSLIALLVGTVVFFALWLVALKPSSSSNGGSSSSSHGLGAFQSDINKAKQAVGTSNASNAASGNDSATHSSSAAASPQGGQAKPGSTPAATNPSASAHSPKVSVAPNKLKHVTAQNLSTVRVAISAHKAVAMLFYNPAAADDQAVRKELASVPTHKGRVVKLAIPLSQASKFTAVTQQVAVNFSPTLVLISTTDQASEILGYSDPFEIDQRVDDALAVG